MAITLRNKAVEEQIRKIGQHTGEGPSAVIARVVAAEAERLTAPDEAEVQRRLARMREFRASLPKFSDEEKKAAWEDLRTMHDYLYEDEP